MHAHHHAYRKRSEFYVPLAREIQKHEFGKRIRIVDLGCGDGNFIREMIKTGIDADFYGTDLSRSMIDMSRELLSIASVDLIIADGLKFPFSSGARFEVIHLDSVLHHLISSNVRLSKVLVREMINKLSRHLTRDGILIVEEMFYNSYLFPGITSSEIFYLLKLINHFHIDLSKFSKEIVPGLEVNFFEERHLLDLLSEYGHVRILRKSRNPVSKYKKLLLLKEFGHISLALEVIK